MNEKEKKETSAKYIIEFYEHVKSLMHNYALYINNLSKISLYNVEPNNNEQVLDDKEKKEIETILQSVRYLITNTYIMYNALTNSLDKNKIEKQSTEETSIKNQIKSIYEELIKEFVFKRNDLEKYVIKLNEFMTDEIMEELLNTSTKIASELNEA